MSDRFYLLFKKAATSGLWALVLLISFLFIAPTASQAQCKKADCKFYAAENAYNKLLKSPGLKKRRDKWLSCIKNFKKVAKTDPYGVWAPAGHYMTGLLYRNLYKYSHNRDDLINAVDYLNRATTFRKSRYSQEASKLLRKLPATKKTAPVKAIVKKQPPSKKKSSKKTHSIGKRTTIKGLRHGSLPTRTRIVIDTDNPVEFKYGLLKKDTSNNKSRRLYVDLKKSAMGKNIRPVITLDDERVNGIRTAYNTPGVVRVAIDLKSYKDYKIFALRSPARVVVDIWGKSSKKEDSETSTPTPVNSQSVANIISSSGEDLAKSLALGVQKIVIDPGHGGEDNGAPGYSKGTYEKDIALSIAKKLAVKIRKKLKCDVIMTRNTDKYITLEERTRIANRNKADLFISIHTNASRSKQAYGIETYFLNLAKDKASVSVAARENATSEKNISDLQTILNSLMKNTKITESSKLAKHVQTSMYNTLRKKYSYIKNKGVKQAPFYVLLGARMPSILVETSFISNKRECKRLKTAAYQNRICDSIISGIEKYIKEVK